MSEVGTPMWARWNQDAAARPWTVGIEDEVMLVSPDTWLPESRCEDVLAALPDAVARHARAETHGSALELASEPHDTVGSAVAQLAELRGVLADTLEGLDLRAAVAGTHPTARWEHMQVSPGARYQFVHQSMRELARREPTFGLHVHVAVPDPESAVRAERDAAAPTGAARAVGQLAVLAGPRLRPCIRSHAGVPTFPRTGAPRRFDGYADYVEAIDLLIRCDAIPEPTFLWWDARLQPAFGTLEVRVMDAQTRVEDTAALAALVQCLVRLEAERPAAPLSAAEAQEVVGENRFIAARDGMHAELIEPPTRVPVGDILRRLVAECEPIARQLDCVAELAEVMALAESPGAERQRATLDRTGSWQGLVEALTHEFTPHGFSIGPSARASSA